MVRIQCSDNNTAHTFITQPTFETVSMCQCPHLSYSTHPRFRESMWHQCRPMAGTTWGPSPMGARPSVRRYHCHYHTRQQRRPSKWIKNCNQEGLMLMKTRMKTKWKVYRRSNDYYEILQIVRGIPGSSIIRKECDDNSVEDRHCPVVPGITVSGGAAVNGPMFHQSPQLFSQPSPIAHTAQLIINSRP